ncbi:MAG TPA: hypothetical protein VFQ61_17690 [Polyangiaceae bacterium]|nr:hypothetical protein [Polyangiaceae bacterium]
MQLSRLVPALLVLASGTGCGKFKRSKECGAVAGAVSTFVSASAPTPIGKGQPASITPTDLARDARATARRYNELDQRLESLHVQSADLAPRVTHYRELARQAAIALEDAATALEHSDAETARRKRVEFDAVARSEPALVAEINNICRR